MKATQLVLASGNAGKLREFNELLTPLGYEVIAQSAFGVPEVDETGLTFVENALLKARQACRVSGLASLADDSGIEVDALNGQPGIYSARFAGEPKSDQRNNQHLLHLLAEVPSAQRTARYWCVVVLMRHPDDPVPIIVQRSWEGKILEEPNGDGGFGYDPLFHVTGLGKTAAALDATQKNQFSHRGRAVRRLVERLSSGNQA
ncbi:RdgB/HAM1 family non-canonical purine NTP pyrophosphatase [Halomonas halocynthiae]|uniref:RdgB/HAM1 family non-canonical purine NTP pyrophosphatase n=1 Tax=Halomonas halocynthiae TaxID=176290 RepID=UPI00041238BF|nr:RdgB/HAM1 family non-canonical purine NTP pyrophosphatase [Halomonas halocynthiae]